MIFNWKGLIFVILRGRYEVEFGAGKKTTIENYWFRWYARRRISQIAAWFQGRTGRNIQFVSIRDRLWLENGEYYLMRKVVNQNYEPKYT